MAYGVPSSVCVVFALAMFSVAAPSAMRCASSPRAAVRKTVYCLLRSIARQESSGATCDAGLHQGEAFAERARGKLGAQLSVGVLPRFVLENRRRLFDLHTRTYMRG